MRLITMMLYLILIVLGVGFAALNATSVEVNFYFKTLTLPVSLLMICMLGLGLLMGFMVSILRYWRLKMDCVRIANQLKLREKEIKNLRDIPLKNQH